MITILTVVMCLTTNEAVCKSVSIPLTEASYGLVGDPVGSMPTMLNCHQRAPVLVAEAMRSYPRYRVRSYTCHVNS